MSQITALSPELQAVALRELNEVPSRIPEDLENLKLWISQQPHLKARIDDNFLLLFLRGSKHSLERAKERIDMYFTLKTKFPEYFQIPDIDTAITRKEFKMGNFNILPTPLDGCGPRISFYRHNFNLADHNIVDVLRSYIARNELTQYLDPYASVYGMVYIFDMALFNTGHLRVITPGLVKKCLTFFTKTMPFRIKGIYYINNSPLAVQMFKILFPFMTEKIRQRVCVCGKDLSELTAHIPLQYLPREYGGENGSLDELTQQWPETLKDNVDFFKENARCSTDESLRPGKPIDFENIYGMDGSFRKLEVD